MKNATLIIFILLHISSLWSQESYFSTASSGLIVRKEPTTKSERIGKLPYGALAEILEETAVTYQVTEGNNTITSIWVKVKYDNFPFIDKNVEGYQWDKTGYVVKHYLQKLNKAHVTVEEIDRATFNKLYKEPIPYEPIKFTDFEDVKKTLSHRTEWVDSEWLELEALNKIFLPNGKILNIDANSVDFGFIAYYPSEETLLFEGGHSSDFSISIRTGESLETVGNPDYIVYSPSGKYRLNGWFPGQECSSYFIQEKTGDYYTYLTGFEYGDDTFANNLCYFKKFAWVDDGKFVYSLPFYSGDDSKYFIGEIKKY